MIPLITFGIAIASSYSVSIEPGPLLGTESFTEVSLLKYFDMKFSLFLFQHCHPVFSFLQLRTGNEF